MWLSLRDGAVFVSERVSHLLLLLALGLLLGGVWDGDVQRGPQRRQVAAAERGLAQMEF